MDIHRVIPKKEKCPNEMLDDDSQMSSHGELDHCDIVAEMRFQLKFEAHCLDAAGDVVWSDPEVVVRSYLLTDTNGTKNIEEVIDSPLFVAPLPCEKGH